MSILTVFGGSLFWIPPQIPSGGRFLFWWGIYFGEHIVVGRPRHLGLKILMTQGIKCVVLMGRGGGAFLPVNHFREKRVVPLQGTATSQVCKSPDNIRWQMITQRYFFQWSFWELPK